MDMSATYSPEDNKLRLYSLGRLPKDLYERVRAAGFIYAPKQELFVAPMWTPEREDLCRELCGEIGDEDTSLVERAEARAERFQDYSANRAEDAEQAHKTVAAICDGIPLGQPILVGHHSERHARKDAERIENGMRKAVECWEQSQYWKTRAAGAVRAAKYKERPDVRARRIKKLEAEKRKQERYKAEAELCLKFWQGKLVVANRTTGEKKPLLMTEENKQTICNLIGNSPQDFSRLPVAMKEGSSSKWDAWRAWDVLQPDGERYAACPSCTVAQCVEAANQHYPKLIKHYDRWIGHYSNRLEYERAMLAEDGGTVADKTGPEVGGGCRCWASPSGGWSYIQKVNRVSVTVLDNWGNGGGNFTRNIPFDKLSAVMTPAQVKEARENGNLKESPDKTGFYLVSDFRKETPKAPAPHLEQTPPEIAAMKETLKAGVQVVTAPQLFPTPPELAARMVELAEIKPGLRVLEPSAGLGSIARALISREHVLEVELVAVEINHDLAYALKAAFPREDIREADFLQCNGDLGTFDRVLMNPPFENASDIKHIKHALGMLKPGGRLVAICSNGPRQHEELEPLCTLWESLKAGTFKESGTMVNTALIVIDKD